MKSIYHEFNHLVGLILIVSLAACSESPQTPPPSPPNIDPLVQSFSAPTGQLNANTGPALVERVADTSRSIEELSAISGLLDELLNSVASTQTSQSKLTRSTFEEDDNYGSNTHALNISGGVWGRLTYTCGPNDDINAERHGRVVLNIVNDSTVSWGQADNCFVPNTEEPTYVNGPLALHLPSLESGDLIADLDLDYSTASESRRFTLGFKYTDDRLSVIQDVEGESFVLTVASDPLDAIGIRDRCGEWSCEASEGRCTFTSATGDCDMLTQEVSW